MLLKATTIVICLSFVSVEASSISTEEALTSCKTCKEDSDTTASSKHCPFSFIHLNEGCYHFSPVQTTWFLANQICHAMNAELLSIESRKEDVALTDYLKIYFGVKYHWWTSGTDLIANGNFYWGSTGQMMDYSNWCENQPDNTDEIEDCVHYLGYCWNDFDCKSDHFQSKPLYFICES